MSKENMSKKNILDYDEEKTIRPQNFTLTAMKEFYDTIESDQFQGASEDTIYKYLTNIMEIVSFKDFLRRYIYEYAGIKENFNQVTNYPELLLEIFARNDCYDPNDVEEKKKLKKKANRWLTSESVKRENMFYIGFGLDMNDKQISEFLTLVLKEPDFDFTSPSETIYWHCRYNGKSWMEAQKLLEAYENQAEDPSIRENHMWQAMQNDPKMYVSSEEGLEKYLHYLKQLGVAKKRETQAREVFMRLYERAQKLCAKHLNRYPDLIEKDGKQAELKAEDINPSRMESILYSGVAVTDNGNLMSFAKLKEQFKSKRLSRARINGILGGKPIERFDLITLIFLIYALDEEKLTKSAPARFNEFVDETNDLLIEAGMIELYPVNPYEAFVMMCVVSEDLLDTFAGVWEKSYKEKLVKVEAVCTSMTGEFRDTNEDNFYFNGQYMDSDGGIALRLTSGEPEEVEPEEEELSEEMLQIIEESYREAEENGEIPDFDDFDVAELLEDNPIGEILHAPEADVSGKWVAVFDGIGGLPCGEMASYIAAVTLAKAECPWRSREEADYEACMWKIAKAMEANLIKWKKMQKVRQTGTTMAALKFGRNYIFGMSLGDSRIYRLREGKLAQLSTDHTYRHPGHIRSALVGYIGTEYEDDFKKMDFYRLEYQKGDKYLLCTDGVTDMVKDEVLEEILQMPVAEARGKMVDEVNRMGAEDNATFIIAEII